MHNPFEDAKNKMQGLTSKQKAVFIWDYYKFAILGALALIGIIIYFVVISLTRTPDPVLSAEVVNSQIGIGKGTDFYNDFLSFSGIDTSEGPVNFSNTLFFDLSRESDAASTYYLKLLAEAEAGTVDAVISNETNIKSMGSAGYFIDLTDKKTASFYKKYKDRVLTVADSEGVSHPVAFRITDSAAFKASGITYSEDAYLAIPPKAAHIDNVGKLLDYLYADSTGTVLTNS